MTPLSDGRTDCSHIPEPHIVYDRIAGRYRATPRATLDAAQADERHDGAAGDAMSFGADVEYAATPLSNVWRLMVWDVPDRLGGLLSRHGFLPTKKNPKNWWRIFDPASPTDKALAARCKAELTAAGLKGSWQEVKKKTFTPPRGKHVPRPSREGFGGRLNARPVSGAWRRKTRRR